MTNPGSEQLTGESELALIQAAIEEMRENNRRANRPAQWYEWILLAGLIAGSVAFSYRAGEIQATVRLLELERHQTAASGPVQARP